MKYEIIFETDRIYFIKLNEGLIDDYMAMINDLEVQKYITHKVREYTLEEELKWLKDNLEKNNMIFSMIEKDTNEYIGNIEISKTTDDNIVELGICINRNKQDKHYGQEAIKKIIDYAFNELNVEEIELNVFDFNPRAIACYKKVGFIEAGVGKEPEDIHMVYKR